MTRLVRQLALCALAASTFVGTACAEELWDPHLRGTDEGLSAGALPPPGVYGIVDNYFLGLKEFDADGNRKPVSVDAFVVVPIVLWQTGWKVFGADYAMGVAQPFDYTNVRVPGAAGLSNNGHWGTYNTILIPGVLSWALDGGWHLSTGLCVYLDDASSSPASPPAGGGVGSGNGYAAIQPDFGVSWLQDGWNVSLGGHYTIPFKDTTTDYLSGQELSLDYTVTKTMGKWTFGAGAYQQLQLTSDTGSGAIAKNCPSQDGCKVSLFGMGPLVGYQFAGVEILAEYNFSLVQKNDVAGDFLNIRLVAPL